jgi:hypothetical protein
MLGNEFDWNYVPYVAYSNVQIDNELDNFYFVHDFYNEYRPKSNHFDMLNPIFKKLSMSSIIRIKANLHSRTNQIVEFPFHTDAKGTDCYTAIYYVNTNNGYTEFENGRKIESVENRLIIFNENLSHRGTTCTDQKIRCLINFNFYLEK